jgi:hypothetical protein
MPAPLSVRVPADYFECAAADLPTREEATLAPYAGRELRFDVFPKPVHIPFEISVLQRFNEACCGNLGVAHRRFAA